MVQWLLDAGCNVDLSRKDDMRPIELLCRTMNDAAMLELEAVEPYWVPEETFVPSKALNHVTLVKRAQTPGGTAVATTSFSKRVVDVEAIKKKFGISEEDMTRAREALGRK